MEQTTYKWKYSETERPIGEYGKCYDCGMPYGEFPDLVLSNELWEKINPSFHKGGGLLCPTCICHRLSFEGFEEPSIKIYVGIFRSYK